MSENLTKLREAIVKERHTLPGAGVLNAIDISDAALAAVEQEMAALRLSYENASRAHFEATKRIDALAEYHAALEAERDELRKRPTLEEVDAFMIERGGWMCVEDFWHVRELFGKPIPADIKAALQ